MAQHGQLNPLGFRDQTATFELELVPKHLIVSIAIRILQLEQHMF
jgi:hypothetical protein